jgi:hypothetical protein
MSDQLLASLEQFGLTQIPPDATHPEMRWAFESGGALVHGDGTPTGLAGLRVGVGHAPDAEALFTAAMTDRSPGLVDGLRNAQSLWLGIGMDATVIAGVPDRPVWMAVFATDGVDLFGEHPLPAGGLELPGALEFPSPLLMRVRVRLRGTALERADVWVSGPVRISAAMGPLDLSGLEGTFTLGLASVNPDAIGALLTNPLAILEAQFVGQLAIELRTSQPVPLVDAVLSGTQVIRLQAHVTSPARSRAMAIGRLRYDHDVSGGLSLGSSSTAITSGQVTLSAELSGWTPAAGGRVVLEGSGTFTLPPALAAVLTSPSSDVEGSFTFTDSGQGAARTTTFEFALGALSLQPAYNPLELSAEALCFTARRQGSGAWSLTLQAALTQSWSRLAARLEAANSVRLPSSAAFADVACRVTITIAASGVDVMLRLSVADGRLGACPIDATDLVIDLVLPSNGPWRASGGGRFTSCDSLARILPFERLPIACQLAPTAGSATPDLVFTVGSGLPPLRLPPMVAGGTPVDLLQLDALDLRFGSTLAVTGRVRLLPSLGNTASRLGLPSALRPVLDPLLAAGQGSTGELRFELQDAYPRLAVTLTANPSAPALDLLGLFAQAVPGRSAAPAAGARASAPMSPLLLLQPGALRFETRPDQLGGARLEWSVSALCTVQGETFDATLAVIAAGSGAEISLLCGTSDPILIRIPASGTRALVETLDQQIQNVLTLYGVSRTSQAGRDLLAVSAPLKAILGNPEVDTLIAFEILNLGLTLRLGPGDEPLSVTGGIRIVQFPPILDAIFTGPTPALIIGSSGTSIFIELRPAPATGPGSPPPLIRIPVTNAGHVDVVLHAVRFGYSWQPPSFELTLRSDVIAPDMPFTSGVGFKLPAGTPAAASASMDIDLQVPSPPAPPVPILNWQMSFLGANPTPATRGLEFIVGASATDRFLTIYLRETIFSPCYFLLMPGGMVDWGVFIGPPPESRSAASFYAEFRCGRGTMITINPVVGVMLNPMAVLPPFLTPTPPYWVIPGLLMGDYFTDETGATGIEFRANLPLLVELEAVFKRPMPTLTLQMFLEIALLVSTQFAVELPGNSALRNLFYAGLSGRVTIHALAGLFGENAAPMAGNIAFNVVEVINGAIRLRQQIGDAIGEASQALQRAGQLVADLARDPALLVRMVPRQRRSIAVETRLEALGFALDCQLSAYVLLPDELREELRMFHENVRPRRKNPGVFQDPPPAGSDIDLPIELDRELLTDVVRITGHRDFIFAKSLTRIETKGRTKLRMGASTPLATAQTKVLSASATKVASEIEGSSGVVRSAVLDRYGIGHKRADIEADERLTTDRTRFRETLAINLQSELRQRLKYSLEVSVNLAAPAADLAHRIAAELLVGRGGQLVLADNRTAAIRRHLPRPVANRVNAELTRRIAPILRPGRLTPGELARRRTDVDGALATLITEAARVGLRNDLAADRLDEAADDIVSSAWIRRTLNTNITTASDRHRTTVTKGTRLRDWFRGFRPGLIDPPHPPPADDTDDPQGYEIRLRPELRALAPDFAVPVTSTATRFRIRLRAGAYRLVVHAGSTEQVHDLPAAFVASLPVGPRKASELQRRLHIGERRVRRPLTAVEQARRKEGDDQQIAGLYRSSIFFSPEYEIRPTGGKRGPLYLADLLRRENGAYVVPDQPIAIAGFRLEILKPSSQTGGLTASFKVRFCGLVAAGSHLLCFGYAEQALRFGSFRVELTGEFRLAVGDIATVPIPSSAAIAPNSMTFAGHLRLRSGGTTLLAGDATATIGPESGQTTIRLTTTVHVEWADEIEIGEVKLVKAWVSADLAVSIVLGRTLQATLDTNITVHYCLGEFDTDVVTVGWEICVPATDICWRESKRVEVTDFDEIVWGDEHTVSGRLKLDLHSSVAGAAFKGTLTANIPLPGGGAHALDVDLPSFAI